MDIKLDTNKRPWIKYLAIGTVSLGLLAAVLLAKGYVGDASALVDRQQLRIATVEQGEFQVEVRGLGSLTPKKVVWLSSRVTGRVEAVLQRAGARVQQGQAILRLSNPQLAQAKLAAASALQQMQAEHQALRATQDSQLLDAEALVAKAEVTYKGHKLELDAQTKLKAMGNSSVSLLNFQRTAFAVENSELDWQIQQQKLAKLREQIHAQRLAQDAKQANLRQALAHAEQQVIDLTVTAPIDGVLQQLQVELGQELPLGGSVGKIADPNSLVAEIQVQELLVQDVALGQPVLIDTRKSQIKGQVSRIDPQVLQGQVAVEVSLQHLPSEARPALSVEGNILVAYKTNALFVQKPSYAQDNQSARIFRLTPSGNLAEAVEVQFGQSSVNHIEIRQGLALGEQIIVSSTQAYAGDQQILLHN